MLWNVVSVSAMLALAFLLRYCDLSSVASYVGSCLDGTECGQIFSQVALSLACWPLSMVACGDREDVLQFVRILPSLREGKMRTNCKTSKNHAEALPLRERDF